MYIGFTIYVIVCDLTILNSSRNVPSIFVCFQDHKEIPLQCLTNSWNKLDEEQYLNIALFIINEQNVRETHATNKRNQLKQLLSELSYAINC